MTRDYNICIPSLDVGGQEENIMNEYRQGWATRAAEVRTV